MATAINSDVPPPADAAKVFDWEDLGTPTGAWRPFRACQRIVPADYEMGTRPYSKDIEVFIWGEQRADGSIPTREICVLDLHPDDAITGKQARELAGQLTPEQIARFEHAEQLCRSKAHLAFPQNDPGETIAHLLTGLLKEARWQAQQNVGSTSPR